MRAFRSPGSRVGRSEPVDGTTPANDVPAETSVEAEPDKVPTRQFRRRFTAVRLSPQEAARQGRAATLAWEKFGNREAMIAFLNTHDDALGGRPIDLAVASDAGLAAVAARLAAR